MSKSIFSNGFVYETNCWGYLKLVKIGTCTDNHIIVPENVQIIGANAFRDCANIISVKLPKGLIAIDVSAFKGCKSLKRVDIPEGVKRISDDAFEDCEELEEIDIPKGIESIGDRVFAKCKSLKKIVVSEGLKKIGMHAFYGCENLETAILPNSLESTGTYIFCDCPKLKFVTIPNKLTDGAFHPINSGMEVNGEVYYPKLYVIYVVDSGRYYAGDDFTTGILSKAKVYTTKSKASVEIFDLHRRFCPDDFIHFIAREVQYNDDFELELVD